MKKICKSGIIFILALVLLFGAYGTTFAAENSASNSNADIMALEEAIAVANSDGLITESERNMLLRNTDESVLQAYSDNKTAEVFEELEGKDFVLLEENEQMVYDKEMDDGGILTIELTDEDDNSTSNGNGDNTGDDSEESDDESSDDDNDPIDEDIVNVSGSSSKTESSSTAYKQIGNRMFTGSCYYQNGFITILLKIENHYTVTSNRNLKKRYISIKECKGFVYCDNSVVNNEWTKASANSIGNYINNRVCVESKVGPLPEIGGNITTKYYYANSRVKLLKRTTKNGKKVVKVQQSLKWDF